MKQKFMKLFAAVLSLACFFSLSSTALAASYTSDEILLARVIQMEGSTSADKTAVASVVVNRLNNTKRWDKGSVKSVVYQKNQFSVVNSSKFSSLKPSSANLKIARKVLQSGTTLPQGVEFFRVKSSGKGVKKSDGLYYWGSHPFYKTIGSNNYYFATKAEYTKWAKGQGNNNSNNNKTPSSSGTKYTFTQTLKLGSSGTQVKNLQRLLIAAGYSLKADGVFGAKTASAVKKFQKKKGYTQDGAAGQRTIAALGGTWKQSAASSPSLSFTRLLRQGDSGSDVKNLQNLLKAKGYSLSVDGKFGPKTTDALKRFQRNKGLTADGIFGSRTAAALGGRWTGSSSSGTSAFSRLLKRGMSGSDVKSLQVLLNNAGYSLSTDGIFGSATFRALQAFQSKKQLTPDGIAGKKTVSALGGAFRG